MRVLTDHDIAAVLDLPVCIESLQDGFAAYARGDAVRRPRIDVISPTSREGEFVRFTTADGLIRGGYYALRFKPEVIHWPEVDGVRQLASYYLRPGMHGGLILLCWTDTAELVAIMQEEYLQCARVGALAGLGARYLARTDSSTLGVLGAGRFARTITAGLAAALPLKMIKVYSPSAEHLRAFCSEMSEALEIPVESAESGDSALSDVDVIATCTNSMEPVLHSSHLRPGLYICNVSSRELSRDALQQITTVGHLATQRQPLDLAGFKDDNFEVRMNTMCYVAGQEAERAGIPAGRRSGGGGKARHVACVDWLTGTALGRESDDEIMLLGDLSGGTEGALTSASLQGLQLVSLAGQAYERAATAGLGIKMPGELFAAG
jgi:alanine dehydrogenase